MDYGIIGHGPSLTVQERKWMKVELTGVLSEATVFTVDGRKVLVPTETQPGKREDGFDMKQYFYVRSAQYADMKSPADTAVRTAIANFLKHTYADDNESYSIDND